MDTKEIKIQKYIEKANEGDAMYQRLLGMLYLIDKSYEEAFAWLAKAAEQGDTASQQMVGDMFRDGEGVTQSYENAAKWYRLAAEQGDAKAQASLGCLYLSGNGVTKSAEDAYKWFAKSAEQGDARAQLALGYLYKGGVVVTQSNENAEKWFRLSAGQGNKDAQKELLSLENSKKLGTDAFEEIERLNKKIQELSGVPSKQKGRPIADNNRSGEVYDRDDDVNKGNTESVGFFRKLWEYCKRFFCFVLLCILGPDEGFCPDEE